MPVLQIRDGNGNFIPINSIRGANGKSAYEQAKEGGYTGTEAEFIALLNGLTNSEDAAHYSDFNNPHKVTATQTGAIPSVYYASDDLNIELQQGGNKMTVCCYHSGTLNTPYSQGLTLYAHGMVITNANSNQYGAQLCMPSGENAIYVRQLNGGGISEWVKMALRINNEGGISIGNGADSYFNGVSIGVGALTATSGVAIGVDTITQGVAIGSGAKTVWAEDGTSLQAIQLGEGINHNPWTFQVYDYQVLNDLGKIPTDRLPFASGSYKGTNVYGTKNPNTLTFDFVPKFVIVCQRGERNATGGGCFIWISQGSTLSFINNGSNYWAHPTLTDKTLSWYCAESASYQLNSSNYEYDYFAWG